MAASNKSVNELYAGGKEGLLKNNSLNEQEDLSEVDKDNGKIVEFISFLSENLRTEDDISSYMYENGIVDLYSQDSFRHAYFIIGTQIGKLTSSNEDFDYKTLLEENLERLYELRDKIGKKYKIDNVKKNIVKKNILRFYDHCRLEISRYNQIYALVNRENNFLKKLEENKTGLKEIEREVKNFKDELSSSRAEYITILGVFAALICASVGGLKIFGDVCTGLSGQPVYKIVFILGLTAFAMFNTFAILMSLIGNIAGKKGFIDWLYIGVFNAIIIAVSCWSGYNSMLSCN